MWSSYFLLTILDEIRYSHYEEDQGKKTNFDVDVDEALRSFTSFF